MKTLWYLFLILVIFIANTNLQGQMIPAEGELQIAIASSDMQLLIVDITESPQILSDHFSFEYDIYSNQVACERYVWFPDKAIFIGTGINAISYIDEQAIYLQSNAIDGLNDQDRRWGYGYLNIRRTIID